jgi:hypothetical protein
MVLHDDDKETAKRRDCRSYQRKHDLALPLRGLVEVETS